MATIDYLVTDTELSDIADAIRAKGGTSAQLTFPAGFTTAIAAIPTGVTPSGTISITANGTVDVTNYASADVNVSGGGGAVEGNDVNFYDYDGTILYSYSAADIAGLSALPDNPTHSGLTSQGWNYTLAQIQTEVADHGFCDVGQMYVTDDDTTRLYCEFEEGRLSPYLAVCPNGTVVVDWGDGSATDTLTGTSLTTKQTVSHTYASAGEYTITLTVTSGEFAFYGVTNAAYILRKSDNTTALVNQVYAGSLRRVELGSAASVGNYAFTFCRRLESITIPNSLTSLGTYSFYYCESLAHITLPSALGSIGQRAFYSCRSMKSISIPCGMTSLPAYMFYYNMLRRVSIPSGVTSIGTYAFQSIAAAEDINIPSGLTSILAYTFDSNNARRTPIVIPNSVTSIATWAFSNALCVSKITIGSGVTTIAAGAFANDYGAAEIHFLPTTPPAVAKTNAFNNLPTDCKIYVPSGTLSAYTSATNYPSSSTYTYVEE